MARILYLLPTQGAIQGGHKIIIRHVEALRRFGFDAYCAQGVMHKQPNWLDHSVPFVSSASLRDDDVIVAPDDAEGALKILAKARRRVVVLSQNPFYLALKGFAALDAFPPEHLPRFMAVSEGLKTTIARAYPAAEVHVVPCFADERLFKPQPQKRLVVAYAPKKRQLEFEFIRRLFLKLHPKHAQIEWTPLDRMREPNVAAALGQAAVFLSLSRLESVGMTTLEAMACRCLCAGFTGVGGSEYARPENGLWVADDDCVAAADAVAHALDLVLEASPQVEDYLSAGSRTAEAWSYRRFEEILVRTWTQLAPDARTG